MERALFLAERGRGTVSPNPIVGAVVVSANGIVVGQGAHLRAGGPHAEVMALEGAGARARTGTLYCTLEPCAHTGRTGPCVERIVPAGISRVVAAMVDPNPLVAGAGISYLQAHGVDVTVGVEESEARRLNCAFITWITRRRPFVIVKSAVSADGLVGRPGERVALTGAAADRFFHRQRAEIDAIAVGAGTVLADDPSLTARLAWRDRPLVRVIFDWRMRVTPGARVFSTRSQGPVIMAVGRPAAEARPQGLAAIEAAGAEVRILDVREVRPVLEWLAERGVTSVLVEGGPRLHDEFFGAGVIDRVQRVDVPARLGSGATAAGGFGSGRRPAAVRTRRLGDDRLLEWDIDADVHGTD